MAPLPCYSVPSLRRLPSLRIAIAFTIYWVKGVQAFRVLHTDAAGQRQPNGWELLVCREKVRNQEEAYSAWSLVSRWHAGRKHSNTDSLAHVNAYVLFDDEGIALGYERVWSISCVRMPILHSLIWLVGGSLPGGSYS